jgi:hypothetical protein
MTTNQREEHAEVDAGSEILHAVERLEVIQTRLRALESRAGEYGAIDRRRGYFFLIQGLAVTDSPDERAPLPRGAFGSSATTGRPDLAIQLTEVDNFPSDSHFAEALRPEIAQNYAAIVGRGSYARHELFVSATQGDSIDKAFDIANKICYLLRAKSGCMFTVPLWSNTSWNQMAGKHQTVHVGFLGREWSDRPLLESKLASGADFDWAILQSPRAIDLYSHPSFQLAFDALGQAAFDKGERNAISTSWSGIEALLGIDQELTYRVAMYLAVLLEDDPVRRVERRAAVKKLYGMRSRAVHGAFIKPADLSRATSDSWQLLRDLIVRVLETGNALPTADQLDLILLGNMPKETHSGG